MVRKATIPPMERPDAPKDGTSLKPPPPPAPPPPPEWARRASPPPDRPASPAD